MVKLAYVPPPISQNAMDDLGREMGKLRPDQLEYALHLVRSWRSSFINDYHRAIKKALGQRP